MFSLVPAGLLIAFGFSLAILSQFRKAKGMPWMISVAGAILAWLLTLILHWIPSFPVYLIGWSPVESFVHLIGFQLDLISWPYSFALVSLILAVVLTSSARTFIGSMFTHFILRSSNILGA